MLRVKYQEQKKDCISDIMYSMGLKRRLLPWGQNKPVSEIVFLIQNIISRRQIPLFNNIINYGTLARGMIRPVSEEPQETASFNAVCTFLSAYIHDAELLRNTLMEQLNALQAVPFQANVFLSLWAQEQVLVEQIQKSAMQIKTDTLTILRNQIQKATSNAGILALRAQYAIGKKKEIYLTIENLAMVSACVSLMIGLDTGDLLSDLRKLMQILQRV